MPTIQQIIENQKLYKERIILFFLVQMNELRKDLRNIDAKNEFIINEKKKLLNKCKKVKTIESINKYFFLSKKRDENYYVWWNVNEEEALILKY